MLASGPWYTSGVLLAWVSIVAGIVVGAAGALIAWLVGYPRRMLVYSMPVATALLTRQAVSWKDSALKVTLGDRTLENPYVVALRVESRSREDIRSSDFDQGKPLVFDLGAEIVTALAIWADSDDTAPTIEGSKIKIEPALIKKGQVLHFNLLTDGPSRLSFFSPLVNVKVVEQDARYRRLNRRRIWTGYPLVCAGLIALYINSSRHWVPGRHGYFKGYIYVLKTFKGYLLKPPPYADLIQNLSLAAFLVGMAILWVPQAILWVSGALKRLRRR